MKKLSVLTCLHLCAIFLCLSISAQDFKTIQNGVEYAETTRGTKEEPVHINLLKLDLTKVRLDVAHAMDAAIGLEKTSSIASRYGALAAINGGFFRLDKSIFAGDAAGILQINGKLLSESVNSRIALGIINGKDKTEVAFGHLNTDIWFVYFTDIVINIKGLNRERKENEMILYTPEFHRTTLTNPGGREITVSGCRPCRINSVSENKGSAVIPSDGFVLSASKNAYKFMFDKIQKYQVNAWASFGSSANPIEKERKIDFEKAEDIVGGVPQLIKNGKIEITWEQEKSSKEFVETRHPRTAVAKLKDGKFLMVTVDGRQAGYSVGMNLNELAAFLLELGATDAMNLDGGGSTTMFLDGKVVNKPSDKEGERSVSDAILVFPRR